MKMMTFARLLDVMAFVGTYNNSAEKANQNNDKTLFQMSSANPKNQDQNVAVGIVIEAPLSAYVVKPGYST